MKLKENKTLTDTRLNFKKDVNQGLSAPNKFLSSKYFYDKKGDALFVDIMNMPEYYLTNAEFDIFKNKTSALIESLNIQHAVDFDLIELGAGDGTKTKELLTALDSFGYIFTFIPVDISENALQKLEEKINSELPQITINTRQGDYFHILEDIKALKKPKVVLFLGSNIGNLKDDQAKTFMLKLNQALNKNDKVVLGVDVIKDAKIVLPAYNDVQGITKRFNLNLLERINTELGGNFNLEKFEHEPEYDENTGIAKSFLTSKVNQTITIGALEKNFYFKAGEKIHMETSRKYNDSILNTILEASNFEVIDKLTDSKNYFADYILNKTSD